MRQVIIYPGENEYYVVEVPSLPGCISQGKKREEAIENIQEAIQLYIEVLREENRPIPAEKDEPFAQVVVPDHKELDRGTLRAITRQAGISTEEFINLL